MSPFHFSRKFKRSLGINFMGFLTRHRVVRAAEILRDPRQSISEVAFAVGNEDEAYFSRVFRKLTGKTPSDFRRKLLEGLPLTGAAMKPAQVIGNSAHPIIP